MLAVCRAKSRLGLGSKDLFLTTQLGLVVTHELLRTTILLVLGDERASELAEEIRCTTLSASGSSVTRSGTPGWRSNTILRHFEEAEFDLKLSGNAVLEDTPGAKEELVLRGGDESEEKEENEARAGSERGTRRAAERGGGDRRRSTRKRYANTVKQAGDPRSDPWKGEDHMWVEIHA